MPLSDSFCEHFSILEDPRLDNHNKRHLLSEVLVITILAIICGAESWVDIYHFGKAKQKWLASFLELPNGTFLKGLAGIIIILQTYLKLEKTKYNK